MLLTHTNTLTQTRTHTQSHLYSTLQTECPHKVVFCLLIKEVAGLRKIPTSVSLSPTAGELKLSVTGQIVCLTILWKVSTYFVNNNHFFVRFLWSTLSFLYAKDSRHWYASHPIISKFFGFFFNEHLQVLPSEMWGSAVSLCFASFKLSTYSFNKPTCARRWCVTSRCVFFLLSPAGAVLVL